MTENMKTFLWIMSILFGAGIGATLVVLWLMLTSRIKIK